MAQVSIENRAINLAAVDPATYRNYTPAESAELQEEWDRVAAGQLALVPDLKKRVPRTTRRPPPGQRPGRADGGHRRVRPADPAGRRGRQRRRGRGARHEAGQRAARRDVPPARTRSRSASRSSGSPATRRRSSSSAPTSTSPCSRRRTCVGSVGQAVGIFNYTVLLGGGRIAPEPVVGPRPHQHPDRPDPGSGHLQQGDLPPARGGAPRGRRARAGRRDPPRRVRRLLLPAVHRRHHPALQPLLRPGARPQRARQPARHRRRDGPHASCRSSSRGASPGAATGATPTRCTSRPTRSSTPGRSCGLPRPAGGGMIGACAQPRSSRPPVPPTSWSARSTSPYRPARRAGRRARGGGLVPGPAAEQGAVPDEARAALHPRRGRGRHGRERAGLRAGAAGRGRAAVRRRGRAGRGPRGLRVRAARQPDVRRRAPPSR